MTNPVVVVTGAAGGCGTSVVACGLALAWARAERRVWLVDFDGERGDVAGGWDLPLERTLDDLAAVATELDGDHLRRAGAVHPSGVTVLASGGRPGAATWDRDRTARLAAAVAAEGTVVVDAGREAAVAAPAATAVVLVCPATLSGCRRAGRLLEAWRATDIDERVAVVWSRGPGAPELGARALGRALGVNAIAELPWAERDARDIAAGVWPEGRRRPLAGAVARLVGALS